MSAPNILQDRTPPPSSEAALRVDDLTVQFRRGTEWTTVVDGVSFSVSRGETLGLVGESGSGKSVTSLAVMGLIPPGVGRIARGSIALDGIELVEMPARELSRLRGNKIAMIFQEPMTSLNPAFTIGEQIGEVLRRHRGLSRRDARKVAAECLDLVGIPSSVRQLDRYPHEFSGGMRQRAMIAMAISCKPDVLIADEPTTALDVTIQAQILDVLRDMRNELGIAMVFITHNMGVVADICDRVAVMYAGQVAESAPVDELMLAPRHPYAEGLLQSVPPLERRLEVLPSIPGHPPEPALFPSHCRFAERCPYAQEECRRAPVMLTTISPEHSVRCVRADELQLRGVE